MAYPALVEAKVLGLKLTEQNKQVMDPSLLPKGRLLNLKVLFYPSFLT
jgi:hypothetical protein